jgi:CBS domain-containing protein
MNLGMDRLTSLRVRDVIQAEVVTVDEHATMAEAAAVLAKHGVSGVPVINVAGKCVGILSAYDFARRENEIADSTESPFGGIKHSLVSGPSQPIHVEGIRENRVGEHMSSAVQTIVPDATLVDAARTFSGTGVHHLVVVDEFERPAGILTTMDLVATIVELADGNHN